MDPKQMNADEIEPEVDPTPEELQALFGDVADAAYEESPVVEGPPIEAYESEESPWGDLIGPEIIAMVRAEVQSQLPMILAEAVRLSREELKRAFAPVRAHREALLARIEQDKLARLDAEFAASAPRINEPQIKALVDEQMSKFNGMDRPTAYKLAIALSPGQELAATEAVMPGMGKPMAAVTSPGSSNPSLNSWFNRNKR